MKTSLVTVVILLLMQGFLAAQVLEPIKARDALTDVIAKAQSEFSQDAELRMVMFAGIDQSGFQLVMDPQTGKASAWIYYFYSQSLGQPSFYIASKIPLLGFLIQSVPGDTLSPVPGLDQLPALAGSWVDSDIALSGSMSGGGGAFFQAHADALISFAAVVHNPVQIPVPPVPPGPVWTFNFVSASDSLTCIVNGLTGVSILCGLPTSVPSLSSESAFELDQNYPNPAGFGDRSVTTIRFRIPEEGTDRGGTRTMSLRLYDALGRLVGTLADGAFDPGNYTISIDVASMKSGIYYYVLHSETRSLSRRLVVTR